MRNVWARLASAGCFVAVLCAGAQTSKQKPEIRPAGLWEITSTMTWLKSPFSDAQAMRPSAAATHTSQICLTREMIDEYGALLPQSHGACRIENKSLELGRMTADWVCSGRITGRGPLESVWLDLQHSRSTVHFQGTFRMGEEDKPVEWTTESTASFKSADCGAVKPPSLPAAQP